MPNPVQRVMCLCFVLALASITLWAQEEEENEGDFSQESLEDFRSSHQFEQLEEWAYAESETRYREQKHAPAGLDPVVSITALRAPKKAIKAYDKAQHLTLKGKLAEAQKYYQEAVKIYPEYAAAWCSLGTIQIVTGQPDVARISLETAVRADPEYWVSYFVLAELEIQRSRWTEARALCLRGIENSKTPAPYLHFDFALASFNLSLLDEAEASALYFLRFDQDNQEPRIHHVLGLTLYKKGDLKGAADHLEAYIRYAPGEVDIPLARKQLAFVERELETSSR